MAEFRVFSGGLDRSRFLIDVPTGIQTTSCYLGYNIDHWLGQLPILHRTSHSISQHLSTCLNLLTVSCGWVATLIASKLVSCWD